MHIALGLGQKSQTLKKGPKRQSLEGDFLGVTEERKRVQYLVWFRGAKAAAVEEVRLFSDNLIDNNSGITLRAQ